MVEILFKEILETVLKNEETKTVDEIFIYILKRSLRDITPEG